MRTNHDRLPYQVTAVMDDTSEHALAFLRKTPTIKNAQARGYAASKLMGHSQFDPEKEKALFMKLSRDREPLVRRDFMAGLGSRHDLAADFRIETILKWVDGEKPGKLKGTVYAGIFSALEALMIAEREAIFKDENLRVANRILRDLEKEEFQQLIVFNSEKVMKQERPEKALSADDRLAKVREWWRAKERARDAAAGRADTLR